MSQLSSTLEQATDRTREIADARSQLAQLAEDQGVLPVGEASELKGSKAPNDAGSDDVDEFLRLLRGWQEEDLKAGGF